MMDKCVGWEGDLFLDEVFFYGSSLFRTHFFMELGL